MTSEATASLINSKVTTLTSQLIGNSSSGNDSDSDDALFAELEAELENENEIIREHGLAEIRREVERVKRMKEDMHGKYTEVTDEKEVIKISASERRCVIHFYHSNFRRCAIMDKHLEALAPRYFGTRFIRVFVENVPFLVERLGIKVLPCLMSFLNGVSKDRLIGFEDLGNNDSFATATLELRLEQSGVIEKEPQFTSAVTHVTKTVMRSDDVDEDGGSDFDLD